MIRLSVILLLLFVGSAQAQGVGGPAPGSPFDTDMMTAVYTEALAFIAPRILEPVPVSQLTVWGLQGLSALDPEITLTPHDGNLVIMRHGLALPELPLPRDEQPAAWAKMAVQATVALYPVSFPLRRGGPQGVIQSFFDEMFSHLGPYSRYVPPAEAGEDRASRGGRAGLGLTVVKRGRIIVVGAVVRDSPASIAGIKPGDVLWAIDGQRTIDQDPETISALLSGGEGSAVTLTWRGHDGRLRDTPMIRVMVPPETVFATRYADVLVLRITSFSQSTASHIALSVQDALSETHPVAGIVLDLRDNRGGLLRQAVTAADTFLPEGVIATTTGRDPDAVHVWQSTEGELAENVPLVILVDGRTASASEVLAAALADRGRAVVVGSATVGKGLVQTIDPLPDGGELFVTWSSILAPLGWPIQGLGVLPQVCTSLGQEALNRQLDELSSGVQPMAAAIRAERAARAPVSPQRVLALRAPCPAAVGHPGDLVVARRLIADPAAYAAALLPAMVMQ